MRIIVIAFTGLILTGCARDSDLEISSSQRKQAQAAYDGEALLRSLEMIKQFHTRNNTELELNAAATAEEIQEAEAGFGCELPQELKLLWQWHNGESTDKFIWYHRFLSVEESLKAHQNLVNSVFSSWRKNWVPVFEFEGEWYGLECGKGLTKASPIIFYFPESGESIAYINLTRYMQVMANAVQQDALAWEADWWKDDINALAAIHAELNPGIDFPYYAGE